MPSPGRYDEEMRRARSIALSSNHGSRTSSVTSCPRTSVLDSSDTHHSELDRAIMDDATRRRALAGDLGPDAQRFALTKIAEQVPPSISVLTSRQKIVIIIVAALLVASVL